MSLLEFHNWHSKSVTTAKFLIGKCDPILQVVSHQIGDAIFEFMTKSSQLHDLEVIVYGVYFRQEASYQRSSFSHHNSWYREDHFWQIIHPSVPGMVHKFVHVGLAIQNRCLDFCMNHSGHLCSVLLVDFCFQWLILKRDFSDAMLAHSGSGTTDDKSEI